MPFLRANGCDFYYEMAGAGTPVLFLHGETHSTRLFDDQFDEFSGSYRCLRYDRRGHANSQVAPFGYSHWNQTIDLEAILDGLAIGKVVIVAVAMSTPIAVAFALKHPDRVLGLALCSWYELDGYPVLEARREKHRLSFGNLHLTLLDVLQREGRQGLEAFMEDNSKTLLQIFPPDKPAVRKKLCEIFACHQPDHYSQSGEYYTSIPHLTPRLRELRCPILGICGTDDPSPDRPDLMAGMPNFRQIWIQGSRRFTMMERPREFNAALGGFLESLPAL